MQISTSSTTILLDIGLPLNGIEEEPSTVEYDLPDLPQKIDAVFISHYHKDHWGLAGLLKESTPLYLPGKAKDLLLMQQRLLGRDQNSFLHTSKPYKPGETLHIGDITVKTHLVDHSAMDACAFEIDADGERIVYTGDFRKHGRKGKLWYKFINDIESPVDKLICEGTMLSRTDSKVPTEDELEKRAIEILKTHEGGLALGWGSSVNFDRITTFYRVAKQTGRELAVDIFIAHMLSIAARGTGLPDPKTFDDIRVYYPPAISNMITKSCGSEMLYPYKNKKLSREESNANPGKYLILTRPSCRPRWLDQITNWENSVLFYSQWSGYRKLKKNDNFLSWLYTKGCRDVTLHTSGHADPDTIRRTIEKLNPSEVIPVHTENPGWFSNRDK
nr:MBL fold metallo-hydrolase [Oceanispirochaeta sp. M1]